MSVSQKKTELTKQRLPLLEGYRVAAIRISMIVSEVCTRYS
jgi:hypothetical protein